MEPFGGVPDERSEIRIAWTLRRVEGLELSEVASLAGCSLATAKRRIAEAEAIIRKHVDIDAPEADA